jgi:hypothetical protein
MIFNSKIKDIEIKMIRENNNCWIKVVPSKRASQPSCLYFIINDEFHNFDIYDKNGKETYEIYFEGLKCKPCFLLISGNEQYKINFDNSGIIIIPIDKPPILENYLKENCSCISPQTSCWAKAIYFTSKPDKYPFNIM